MKCIHNLNLIEYNSYKLGAVCKKAWFPNSEHDIINLLKDNGTDKIIIGNGNNIIFSKEYYDQEFIIFQNCFNKINFQNAVVEAEAGATLLELSERALDGSLTGFEAFFDIPGSVGGAIAMNAGTAGVEIGDITRKVRFLNLTNLTIHEVTTKDIKFGYRTSLFYHDKNKLILKAWFQLKEGHPSNILDMMNNIKNKRWERQPRNYPSCGSVFKRPKGYYVGKLIEEIGMKGYKIGGAKISEKHAGFIINDGNASGKDIIKIIFEVKRRISSIYDINLEVEPIII